MSLVLNAFHVAIHTALAADTTFMAAIGSRLYDNVPQTTLYPLAQLRIVSNDDSRKSQDAERFDVELHVWSQYRGAKEAETIAALAHACLHKQPSKGSGTLITCYHLMYVDCPLFVEPDNLTRHAVVRFSALAQPKT